MSLDFLRLKRTSDKSAPYLFAKVGRYVTCGRLVPRIKSWETPAVLSLHFIQCPFPNQIQFGLERKKLILQDADSKPNSDWFGKF